MVNTTTHTQKWLTRTNIAVFCALGMLVGFLSSRVVLTLFTMGFGIAGLWGVHPKKWFRDKWWLLGISWILFYVISYFWTVDKHNWSYRFDVKLPILLLPLAFTLLPAFSKRQLTFFTVIASGIFVASAVYSLSFFIVDPAFYAEQYVYSHVLPTLAYGDHIRYSLAVALFIIWSVYYLPRIEHKGAKWWVIIAAIFLSVYLHILAARTGLVIWYLFVALWSLRLLFTQSLLKGIAVIALLVIGSTLAVRYIPTLEKRVWYIKHTYELYRKGDMASGYSDMGRLISYDIATDKIKQNLFTGVGAGDMLTEMNSGYDVKYPDVPAEYRLLPHNQFLIVCLGCGMVAFALFVAWVCYPLRWVKRTRDGFFLFTVWLSLLLALLVEPMLEVQLGVFVYLFFLLWQRHAMQLKQ